MKANTTVARYQTPLAFQPGAKWHYGTGIDWAGIFVTRVTGRSLEEYFQEFIFRPMKMTSTSFLPNASIKERMMSLTQNLDNTGITAYPDNFKSIPFGLDRESDPDKVGPCFAGGAGLFSTALDYLAMLRGIMASAANEDGSSDSALLSSRSFRELFHDSIPSDADRSYLLEAMTGQTYHDPILLKEKDDGIRRTGHSVGLLLNFVDSCYGRKAGSGCWDGAAKTQYWLDPVTGLAVSRAGCALLPTRDIAVCLPQSVLTYVSTSYHRTSGSLHDEHFRTQSEPLFQAVQRRRTRSVRCPELPVGSPIFNPGGPLYSF